MNRNSRNSLHFHDHVFLQKNFEIENLDQEFFARVTVFFSQEKPSNTAKRSEAEFFGKDGQDSL